MKRLLSIELQKIWKNKASRVLTISYFILLSSIALITTINFKFIGIDFKMAEMGIFDFPFIWHFNTWVAALFKFFLAIVIVSMVANEYSYGTLKQNLIDGMSKKEFIMSKFLTVVLFSFCSTLFVFIMTLILGYNYSSFNETSIVFMDISYIAAYFVKLIGFFSFCLFLGILIKRSAFAIGFIFVWFCVEVVLIHFNIHFPDTLKDFLPLESMSDLIVEPISRFKAIRTIESQVSNEISIKDYSVHLTTIGIVLVWTVIFIFSSFKIIQKRDL